MSKFKYFTDNEIKKTIKNNIDGYEGTEDYTFEKMEDDLFNTDDYFIGDEDAEKALQKYGIFQALQEVQQNDVDEYGEWITDLSDPEKVANRLERIKADNFMNLVLQDAGLSQDDEMTSENVKKFMKSLKEY